jgi:uncharacterized membrane protein
MSRLPKKRGQYSIVQIRYNTTSDGTNERWRVICDGNEFITNKICIKGELLTTKDYIENVGFKNHFSIADVIVDYSVDYTLIYSYKKTVFTDILKTITYRILGTSVTFGIGYFATGNLNVATALGFSDLLLKPLVYFLHERLWRSNKNV